MTRFDTFEIKRTQSLGVLCGQLVHCGCHKGNARMECIVMLHEDDGSMTSNLCFVQILHQQSVQKPSHCTQSAIIKY